MEKETAVEWLVSELNQKIDFIPIDKWDMIRDIVQQAKEIEKEQSEKMYSEEDMKNAFDSAREFNSLDGIVDVHVVLPMGGDMSDLQPLHFTFEKWFEQFKKK